MTTIIAWLLITVGFIGAIACAPALSPATAGGIAVAATAK